MHHLIDSYSVASNYVNKGHGFQTVSTFSNGQDFPYSFSITIKNVEEYSINKRILEAIKDLELLTDNWDEMDALKPNEDALSLARVIALYMEAIGQRIFSIAPGPSGEIMLDFRNRNKSFELLFYPNKNRFVKFSEDGQGEQGIFSPEIILPELLNWLNS